METIRKEETLTIVSDGGLKSRSVFGWIISEQEEILVKCRGSTRAERGHMSSFRPEAT